MSTGAPGGGFDVNAGLYDRARPRYPEELFDRLLSICNLAPTACVLEIGPGTGQATESLARRGFQITAVEIGKNLAAIARQNLAPYPNVAVLSGAFETTALPAATFDLVCAATSFHWIRPRDRFAKPHLLLRAGGHLAIIHTEQVSDEAGDRFTAATQALYRTFSEGSEGSDFHPSCISELEPMKLDTAFFAPIAFEKFPVQLFYTRESYLELLRTFSPTLAMAPDIRDRFLGGIGEVIERGFGGHIVKHVAMTLLVAQKV